MPHSIKNKLPRAKRRVGSTSRYFAGTRQRSIEAPKQWIACSDRVSLRLFVVFKSS